MTNRQRLEIEQSSIRERINASLAKEGELKPEERTELDKLTTRAQALEVELRAAIVLDDPPTKIDEPVPAPEDAPKSEERELRKMFADAQLGSYVSAAMTGGTVSDGVERELNDALEIKDGAAGVEVPLALLGDVETRQEEKPGELRRRADSVTDLSVTDHGVTPKGWLDRIFGRTVAQWLGISFESVSTGISSHLAVTGGASAKTKAPEAAQDAESYTVAAIALEPNRLVARYIFRVEDAARLAGLEAAMRRDLASALADALDHQVVNGQGVLITGLLGLAATQRVNVEWQAQLGFDVSTIQNTLNALAGLLDGKYAVMPGDIKTALSPLAFANMVKTYAIATEPETGYELLNRVGFATRSTHQIAGPAAVNDLYAIVALGNMIAGSAVASMWPSVSLIRDPYTDASKGLVALTATNLWDFHVIRADNWRLFKMTT